MYDTVLGLLSNTFLAEILLDWTKDANNFSIVTGFLAVDLPFKLAFKISFNLFSSILYVFICNSLSIEVKTLSPWTGSTLLAVSSPILFPILLTTTTFLPSIPFKFFSKERSKPVFPIKSVFL